MQLCWPGNFVIATRHPRAIFMAPAPAEALSNLTGHQSRRHAYLAGTMLPTEEVSRKRRSGWTLAALNSPIVANRRRGRGGSGSAPADAPLERVAYPARAEGPTNPASEVVPGRRAAASPEPITTAVGVMDSGLARCARAPE